MKKRESGDFMALFVLDIGGSAVKYALWDKQELSNQGSFPTPLSRQEFLSAVSDLQTSFAQQAELTGIAISCPGDIDQESGLVKGVSFVPFLHVTPIRKEIESSCNLPVTLYNDANSAALAEMRRGIGQGCQNPLFMIVGSGIGLSIVKEGEVLEQFDSSDDKRDKSLGDLIRSFKGITASPVQTAKIVSLLKLEKPSSYDGEEIYELAAQGDEVASKQIESMYNSLAEIILALQSTLHPEFIGIGGGITNNKDFIPDLQHYVDEMRSNETWILKLLKLLNISDTDTPKPVLKICEFKNDANLIGAALFFEEHNKASQE